MATYNKDKDEELKKNQSNTLNGVDEATNNKISNPSFTASNDQQAAQNKANSGLERVEDLTSKNNIVSGDVWNTLNSTFTKPTAVIEADGYLKTQLQKIQSGKTSYSDQVKDLMAQIQGREKFSYDVDNDPLFQQALASAMSSGKQAMQDTIGQASALTGGYGSTYATTAGNQAYNSFIEDAYDNLPQYYQMAMEAYQMEGDEMYRQLGMLNDADATEYNRNVTAYDATYQHRNQMYNEAYQQFRDSKADAMNMANLQLNEHGQLVSDAMNYYNATSDYANTLYNREYQKWNDEVNQAMQYAQMLNNDYWNQTNYDRGVYESDRAYERGVLESDRDYNRRVEEYNDSRYWDNYWNQEDLNYKNSALAEDKRQFNIGMGDTNNDGVVSDEEYAKYVERYGSKESKDKEKTYPKTITDRISTMSSNDDIANYLANQVVSGVISQDDADELASMYSVTKYASRNWTMSYDGGNNGNGGIDNDARVKDEYGREIRLDELVNELVGEGMSQEDAKTYVLKLQKNLGITKN